MQLRVASFNVENLFARAKALNTITWAQGRAQLAAFERFTATSQHDVYTDADKQSMIDDLIELKVLVRTATKVIKQPNLRTPLAWLRENRGDFLLERQATGAEIVADGRSDWIGWLELVTEATDEIGTRMTARVVSDVAADILVVVEAEDRPSLVQFNTALLADQYRHVMLVDGNDIRGIDVGLLTTDRFPIGVVSSHVDDRDVNHPDVDKRDSRLFSRDAPVYRVDTGDEPIWVIANHLKSQSFTGSEPPDQLRGRQSARLAEIYSQLRASGARLVVLAGDFNRGVASDGSHPSLEPLFAPALGLVDAFSLAQFQVGPRPGTFQGCSLRDRLDYLFMSPDLAAAVTNGGVYRKGLWGRSTNVNPPQDWEIYPEITASRHAASDHAAVWVDLDLDLVPGTQP
jgi:endonuclease/exonuclease/phosphatase family metal-dependent hydrolase